MKYTKIVSSVDGPCFTLNIFFNYVVMVNGGRTLTHTHTHTFMSLPYFAERKELRGVLTLPWALGIFGVPYGLIINFGS